MATLVVKDSEKIICKNCNGAGKTVHPGPGTSTANGYPINLVTGNPTFVCLKCKKCGGTGRMVKEIRVYLRRVDEAFNQ